MLRRMNSYIAFLVIASPSLLFAEPLEFNRKAKLDQITLEQAATILVDFSNQCDSGCKYYHKGMVQSEILEQSSDQLLVWQKTNEVQINTHFRKVQIERSDSQIVITMKFPEAQELDSYRATYKKDHNSKLSRLDEVWTLSAQGGSLSVNLKTQIDSSMLSLPFAKRIIVENYERALNETFQNLKQGVEVPLLEHDAWDIASESQDIFKGNGEFKPCSKTALTVEDAALEIKTGPCNNISLYQPSRYRMPVGTKIRFVAWHNALTSEQPAEGRLGVSIKNKAQWQEAISIPKAAASYEATFVLDEAVNVGDPIVIHIDNHGANSWKILGLYWTNETIERQQNKQPTYYHDIKPILDTHCAECHSKNGSAGFALDTFEQARAWAYAIRQAVKSKVMPPWGLDRVPGYSYKYDLSLSDEQIQRISTWVDAGRPMGAPEETVSLAPIEKVKVSRIDTVMAMSEPYKVKANLENLDEYRCFPIGAATQEDFYITGYKIVPSNPAVSHHATVYAIPPEYAAVADEMDESDADIGYSCYGDPIAQGFEGLPISLVAVGAHATHESLFPVGTGLHIKKGTRFILQMHFSVAGVAQDQSLENKTEFHIQTEKKVEKAGLYLNFFDMNWMLPGGMKIPAGEKNVTHSYTEYPPAADSAQANLLGLDLSHGALIHIIGSHMHELGSNSQFRIVRANGVKEPFFDLARWNFKFQREYHLTQPVLMEPTEKLEISCTWDNSPAHQPKVKGELQAPQDVYWGNDTRDEMCAGLLFVTEP